MWRLLPRWIGLVVIAAALVALGSPCPALAGPPEPIVATIRIPDPATHEADVTLMVPTEGRAAVELRMARWTPGFYRVEDYASRLKGLQARTPEGAVLEVEPTRVNRWRVQTGGSPRIVVSYRLTCRQHSVTTNWVDKDLGVFNGAPTFLVPIEPARRPYEVRIERPATWKRTITALAPAPDGLPDHYRAEDYDTLVDSPIVAGDLVVQEFDVEGSRHFLVDVGERGAWDSARAARDLETMVRETRRYWGVLPFRRYVFLNVFRPGGGGLEHKDCALLTARAPREVTARSHLKWLEFVAHEYFHAFNVKRLRPVELGPFDYEEPPRTPSLWISEGLTTYGAELILARTGLSRPEDFLAWLSTSITLLQDTPGRLVQTLEQASLEVWTSSMSGIQRSRSEKTVSYYEKGPIVGFLLDTQIRRATDDRKNLDDVMRLAYARYSGARGFTPDEFRAVAEEVAGVDLREWFRRALASTDELEYQEALDWFGLRFADAKQGKPPWKLEVREDATEAQRTHFRGLVGPSEGRP
jgi:predicted metalloprotease with PDZ domain